MLSCTPLTPQAAPIIRYRLPSQLDELVDVVDSDDVQLMLEEHEVAAAGAGPGAARWLCAKAWVCMHGAGSACFPHWPSRELFG